MFINLQKIFDTFGILIENDDKRLCEISITKKHENLTTNYFNIRNPGYLIASTERKLLTDEALLEDEVVVYFGVFNSGQTASQYVLIKIKLESFDNPKFIGAVKDFLNTAIFRDTEEHEPELGYSVSLLKNIEAYLQSSQLNNFILSYF